MNTKPIQLESPATSDERRQLIGLLDVGRVYTLSSEPVAALSNIDLKVSSGEFLAIMGASGSGKSTLMNIIGCLDQPTTGTYLLNGRDITGSDEDDLATIRNKWFGFVFQQFNLLPEMTALENVMLPLIYAEIEEQERRDRAVRVLTLLGLEDRLEHLPRELSGGQQQRVSMARALVNDPKILLADEPTGQLDSKTSKDIMQLLRALNEKGMTIIIVTHDKDVAAQARRLVQLMDGRIIADSIMTASG